MSVTQRFGRATPQAAHAGQARTQLLDNLLDNLLDPIDARPARGERIAWAILSLVDLDRSPSRVGEDRADAAVERLRHDDGCRSGEDAALRPDTDHASDKLQRDP